MIRYAIPQDLPALQALWKQAFGDDQEELQCFYRTAFPASACLVWEEAERPVSMLHAFPCSIETDAGMRPMLYLYAGATLPACRGRGYYGRLLRFFEQELAPSQGISALCLIPATPSLYEYYAQYGYERAFFHKKAEFRVDELPAPAPIMPASLQTAELQGLRQAFSRPGVVQWGLPQLEFVCHMARHHQGGAFRLGSNYAVCQRQGGALLISELSACHQAQALPFAAALQKKLGGNRVCLRLPPYADFGTNTASAMLLTLDSCLQETGPLYLNLGMSD